MVSAILTGNVPKVMRVVPRSRNIEALLLFFVFGINAYELAQIQLSTLEVLRPDFWFYWLPLTLAALVVHGILRRKASEADSLILPLGVFLNGLGLAEIYRLDLHTVAVKGTDLFAGKQIAWTCLAIAVAAIVVIFVPSHLFLRRYVYLSMFIGVGLLLSPMLPIIGRSINGARLWIGIGPLTFQPGELAKIALTVFFAGYLVTRRDSLAIVGRKVFGVRIPRARELGPIISIWVASLLVLVLQHDLGARLDQLDAACPLELLEIPTEAARIALKDAGVDYREIEQAYCGYVYGDSTCGQRSVYELGLTGTNIGCDTSSCGACTIHVDGQSVKSCTMLAVQADGLAVTTIEGLAKDGKIPKHATWAARISAQSQQQLAASRADQPSFFV